MIFFLQIVEDIETIVDGIEFCRIKVCVFQMTTDILCDVFQFDITAVEALYQIPDIREHPFDALEGRGRCAERTDYSRFFRGEGVVGFIEGTLDLLRVAHGVALLFQFFLLTFR